MHESEKWKWSHAIVYDSLQPHGLQPTRLLRPWDFPSKSTGVGCHCLLWIKCLKVTQIMNNSTGFSYQVSLACSPRDSLHCFPYIFQPLSFFLYCAVAWSIQLIFPLSTQILLTQSPAQPPVSVTFLWCRQLIFLLRTSVVFSSYTTLFDVLTHYLILTTLYAFAFHPFCENLNF